MKWVFIRSKVIPPVITLLVLATLFEFLVKRGLVQDFIIPAPSQVITVFFKERDLLVSAGWFTFSAASLGLLGSIVGGTLIAILLSTCDFLRRAIYPFAVFFQTVPIIAIAPLLVIWFGFGQPTVVASSFIVSIFPIIASTLLGLRSTDPHLVDLFRLYSTSWMDGFLKLKLPFALPFIFSGIRIASGLSVVGAIVGEFISGGGLGGVVDSARTQQRVDLVFAAVLMSSVLGLVFITFINYFSWLMLRHWHVSEQK